MSPFRFLILSIIQFTIIYLLEATSTHPLEITKRCTNKPKLVSKSIPTKKLSKWLEEDANRKQFELVNKSWRKTNIFLDVKTSFAPKPTRNTYIKKYQTKSSAANLNTKRSSTPSFFEFYYRDELDPVSVRNKKKNMDEVRNRTNKKRFQNTSKSKFLKYPIKGSDNTSYNKMHSFHSPTFKIENYITKSKLFDHFDNFFFHQRKPELTAQLQKLPTDSKASHASRYIFDHLFERLKRYDSDLIPKENTTDEKITNDEKNSTLIFMPTQMRNISKIVDLSTLYDKIKFFEMYDDNTENSDDNLEEIESNKNDFIRNLTNFVNKSIFKTADYEEVSDKIDSTNVPETINNFKYIIKPMEKDNEYGSDKITRDLKELTTWEDYPFVAVYIYKPLKVYCDAAALSSHWLITSGHCLSQTHNSELYGKIHSAYVTYCGSSWKEPGRMSYVKYSLIHPKFNANDEERKYLYNVGIVQVVTPLSTCPGWAPVIMVSHQFIPTNDPSTVTTIGWGLDRFKGKPSSPEITKQRQIFSVNTAVVTSGDCISERLWTKRDVNTNVYCLRTREEGHVRGSLMMYHGRLVALYLQESVPGYDQYTGLWKVVPWLNLVIKDHSKEEFLPYD